MKFNEFKQSVENHPIFRSNIFPLLTDNPGYLRRQMTQWVRKGLVIELKRGLYTLAKPVGTQALSLFFLANELYSPSYISLESALSYYRMIPERVEVITSVTSKKTKIFENVLGKFTYSHIKQSSYDYFTSDRDENQCKYLIATPEKAILDYLYFNTPNVTSLDNDYFTDSLRLQNLSLLSPDKLLKIATEFKQKKLLQFTHILIEVREEEL